MGIPSLGLAQIVAQMTAASSTPYLTTQKHLPLLKTQLQRRKRHTPKTADSAATREKKPICAREK